MCTVHFFIHNVFQTVCDRWDIQTPDREAPQEDAYTEDEETNYEVQTEALDEKTQTQTIDKKAQMQTIDDKTQETTQTLCAQTQANQNGDPRLCQIA
jgi:hypothetical protein